MTNAIESTNSHSFRRSVVAYDSSGCSKSLAMEALPPVTECAIMSRSLLAPKLGCQHPSSSSLQSKNSLPASDCDSLSKP